MTVELTTVPPADLDADLLVAFCAEGETGEMLRPLVELLGDIAPRVRADVTGEKGEAHSTYAPRGMSSRLGFVGLGPHAEVDTEGLRRAAAAAADLAAEREAEGAALLVPDIALATEACTQALVEGFRLAAYRFRRYKTGANGYAGPQRLLLAGDSADGEAARRGAERGHIGAEAACSARDLVNRSPDEKTALRFSDAVARTGRRCGFEVTVWQKPRIREEGMGGLLAVNRGSEEPPTFSVLQWKPDGARNERPVILAGKGVVFDTGGLSLKPTKNSMDMMKADMAGAAAVVGAFEALARLEVPLHVVGLIPATDNRPGKDAYVPGDVVRMHSGTTVEVLNTDAEGRLILADALSYAKTFDPELVIDLATLTGAQIVALGAEAAAVMTPEGDDTDARLAPMLRAGRASGERVHPLPLYEDYGPLLDSDVADCKNVGGKAAGAITAGKFLERFMAYPWIHLDIAGPAFLKKEKPYRPAGGTGFGVRLLLRFLRDYAQTRRSER